MFNLCFPAYRDLNFPNLNLFCIQNQNFFKKTIEILLKLLIKKKRGCTIMILYFLSLRQKAINQETIPYSINFIILSVWCV